MLLVIIVVICLLKVFRKYGKGYLTVRDIRLYVSLLVQNRSHKSVLISSELCEKVVVVFSGSSFQIIKDYVFSLPRNTRGRTSRVPSWNSMKY